PVRDAAGRIVAVLSRRDDTSDGQSKYLYMSSARCRGPRSVAPVHLPLGVEAPCPTCRITEGALTDNVAQALSEGPTIGAVGLGWRAWMDVLLRLGFDVVRLAFDADATSNPHVARTLNDCANGLSAAGYEIELESWPMEASKAIDDLLAAGGT